MSNERPDNPVFATIETRIAGQLQVRHEMRTSLNAIIGYSEMLRQEAHESGLEEFQGAFRQLHKASQRMLMQANAILEAAKHESQVLDPGGGAMSDRLRRELQAPLESMNAYCAQLIARSREVEREGFVADLERIQEAVGKLQSLFDGPAPAPARAARHVAAVSRPRATVDPIKPAKRETGTLLIVDDSESNRDILSRQLHREGHTVFAAHNGAMALQLLQGRKFELILLGVIMAEMDGLQVLERLKARADLAGIPVIMISTLDEMEPVVRCLEMGADDYLSKPFNPVILNARISACLQRKRLLDTERAQADQLRQEQEQQAALLKDLAAANWELAETMEQLKATQAQLLMQEKLASLGALTAGIAHEIKNPLNFVNNFAVLTGSLATEIDAEVRRHAEKIDADDLAYLDELLQDLRLNAEKIHEHGKRADSIVRSMLLHSHGQSGQWQPTALNDLLTEYIHLAYHGMRANEPAFNLTIETDLDPTIGQVNVVPQDLGRVFLNLLNNACYAVHEKTKSAPAGYSPTLTARTRKTTGGAAGDEPRAEIRIRDNGSGIPSDVVEKIFNPFFTTKPPGQGTGLGLSISYEIIVQEHKGDIRVETEAGSFTEFLISLPI